MEFSKFFIDRPIFAAVLSIVIFLAVEALKAVRRRGDAFMVGS